MNRDYIFEHLKSYDDLLKTGVCRANIAAQVENGQLIKIRPGIFYTGTEALRYDDKAMAEIFSYFKIAPDTLFCHQSAALLHQMHQLYTPRHVHLYSATAHRAASGAKIHRIPQQGIANPWVYQHEMQVTSPIQTVLDCCKTLTVLEGLVIADSAVNQKILGFDELKNALDGYRGRGSLRVRQVADLLTVGAQSVGETATRYRLYELSYPKPALQVPVNTPAGVRYLDLAYEDHKLAIEFDGNIKYTEYGPVDSVLMNERSREKDIQNLGWYVLRVNWEDVVTYPDRFKYKLRKAWRARMSYI
ncbi:MAG: hypothetical protein Q3965_01990 [Rothia sp. (in: high G+C Gram-positive bacteria)]|nr:hypothetical protein [Rothia sp. (in: high G+C Gram-positive bacteria)]